MRGFLWSPCKNSTNVQNIFIYTLIYTVEKGSLKSQTKWRSITITRRMMDFDQRSSRDLKNLTTYRLTKVERKIGE